MMAEMAERVQVGRQEPVMVLRVDKEKGYIDLSKRRVAQEDIAACEERYNKSKMVHSIMRHVAETSDVELEKLYSTVGWPLYKYALHSPCQFPPLDHRCSPSHWVCCKALGSLILEACPISSFCIRLDLGGNLTIFSIFLGVCTRLSGCNDVFC